MVIFAVFLMPHDVTNLFKTKYDVNAVSMWMPNSHKLEMKKKIVKQKERKKKRNETPKRTAIIQSLTINFCCVVRLVHTA